ncbi:regucalcin [Boletus reticuloceps]|uniref:Regucalcin n=1 Tax=Boletus reticuloceps TaxID=495285 RepID=A0A8I2YYV2_9AGAM|nr:regucalcin [Boletus reticuloceps]
MSHLLKWGVPSVKVRACQLRSSAIDESSIAPLYDPKTQILHFVDICENKIFHLDTKTLAFSVETFDEPITCLALRNNEDGLACTTASGFAVLDEGSALRHLRKPLPEHHTPYVRFNDGACDSKGRFFAGSIHSKDQGIPGQLWMYDPDTGECKVVDEGPFTNNYRYFTDSLTNLIYAYDFDDGKLSNRRIVVDAIAQGLPENTFCDGLCIDDEGYIWSARFVAVERLILEHANRMTTGRWGGSRIVRFSPQGNIDTEIYFPTALNVTACCFGGVQLPWLVENHNHSEFCSTGLNEDQLYVTTAHCGAVGGDSNLQEKYPDSGHLFVVDLSGHYKGGRWRYPFGG